jgi:hypothetical protein
MRRFWRVGVLLAAVVAAGVITLMPSSGAQVSPPPGFTIPSFPPPPTLPPFTFPSIPPPPTMPPLTQPPPTQPPPTMPPPTQPPPTQPPPTSPPPTQPPVTLSRNIDQQIENIIDQLEQFGDQFQDAINELRALQATF